METDLSLIEIGGADDSLLETLIKEEDNTDDINHRLNLDLDSPTVDFTCSPLVRSKPSAKPARFPHFVGSDDKDERTKPSLVEANNKENLSEDQSYAPISTKEQNQVKRRKVGGFNLRKSLAWNNAFFTEEGVLDPVELSRLSGSLSNVGGDFLCTLPEEGITSLPKHSKTSGDGSHLKDVEKKQFYKLPPRSSPEDKRISGLSLPKIESSVREDAVPIHKVSFAPRRVHIVKGVDRTASQAGGSIKPSSSSSQKNLPSTNVRNAPLKESRLPKLPSSKSESSSASTTSKIAVGAKRSHSTQNTSAVNIEKNIGRKGSSSDTKFSIGCISSTAKSSIHQSAKNMENLSSVRRLSSTQPPQPGKAPRCGLKVTPDHTALANKQVPGDTGSGRAKTSLQENTCYVGGSIPRIRSQPAKPSGLRMPSPSLGFFSQPKVSASASIPSPRENQSCNFNETSIPNLASSSVNKLICEIKTSNAPPTSATVPKEGILAMDCADPSSVTTSHLSKSSLKVDNLQAKGNGQSNQSSDNQAHWQSKSDWVHAKVDEHNGKQLETRNPAYDEGKYISFVENKKLQLNANIKILQGGSSELSENDNHLENIMDVEQKLNGSGIVVMQGVSGVKSEVQVRGGPHNLINHQHEEGVQESSGGNRPVDHHQLNECEMEIVQNIPLLETKVCDGSGEHKYIEEVREFQKSHKSDNHVLKMNEAEISPVEPLVNCETQEYGVSGEDDLIDQHDQGKINEGIDKHEDNRTGVVVLQGPLLVDSDVQVCEGPDRLVEHQHDGVQESSGGNTPVHYHQLDESELEVAHDSSSLDSEAQVYNGSGESQHNEEVQESPRSNTSDSQDVKKSEVEILPAEPPLDFEMHEYGVSGADDLIELQQGEVEDSFKINMPKESEVESSQSLPLLNSEAEMKGESANYHESVINVKHKLNGSGIVVLLPPPLVNSEMQICGELENLTAYQHEEGGQKSSGGNRPVGYHELNDTEFEIPQDPALLYSETQVYDASGEHRHGEEDQGFIKGNTSDDDLESEKCEVVTSTVAPLLNSEKPEYSVLGLGHLIEHQHEEGVKESSRGNSPVNYHQLDENEIEISQASPLLNLEAQVYGGSEEPHLAEEVGESPKINMSKYNQEMKTSEVEVSAAGPLPDDDSIANYPVELQHVEEVEDSLKINRLIMSEVEVSQFLPLMNPEVEMNGGANNLIEHQHRGEVHCSSESNKAADAKKLGDGVEFSGASPMLNYDRQVYGGTGNLVVHQHAKGVHESWKSTPVDNKLNENVVETPQVMPLLKPDIQVGHISGTNDLNMYHPGIEEGESLNRNRPVDNQEPDESGLDSPLLNSETQVYGSADNSVKQQNEEGVPESLEAGAPGDNQTLNELEVETSQVCERVDNLAEHPYVEEEQESLKANVPCDNQEFNDFEVETSQALTLPNSDKQASCISGVDDIIGTHIGEIVHESSERSISADNEKFGETGVGISDPPPLVNSGPQVCGETDDLIELQNGGQQELVKADISGAGDSVNHQHVEEVHESPIRSMLAHNQGLDEKRAEVSEVISSPYRRQGGAKGLIEHQKREGVRESLKDNMPETDDLIMHQAGEEINETPTGSTPVDYEGFTESGLEIEETSEASRLLYSEAQAYGGAKSLIKQQYGEGVQELLKCNIPVADDLIKHQNEDVLESFKRSPELPNEAPNKSEEKNLQDTVIPVMQLYPDNLVEHHGDEVQQSPRRKSLDNQELDGSEVEFSGARISLSGEMQHSFSLGEDNGTRVISQDEPLHNIELHVDDVSGEHSLIDHQHWKEEQDSHKRNTSVDSQDLHEREVEYRKAPPMVSCKSEVYGVSAAKSLIDDRHWEAVDKSSGGMESCTCIESEDAIDTSKASAAVVHNDYMIVRDSGEQVEIKMRSLDDDKKILYVGNHLLQKDESIVVEQSRASEDYLEDNVLGTITFSSQSINELRKVRTDENEEVEHSENSIRQTTNDQGIASEDILGNDCGNFSCTLENTYSCETKMETSVILSQVRSMIQEKGLTVNEEVIVGAHAQGLEVVSLDKNSSGKNLDLYSSTQFRDSVVGDNLDEQAGEQARQSKCIPEEIEQLLHEKEHVCPMVDDTFLKQSISAQELPRDVVHDNVINATPQGQNPGGSNSKRFQFLSEEAPLQMIEVGAGSVSTVEHARDEKVTIESLSIKPSAGKYEVDCAFPDNDPGQSTTVSEEYMTPKVLSTHQASGASVTCSLNLVASSTEKLDSPVQKISDENILLSMRCNGPMNNQEANLSDPCSSEISECELKNQLGNDDSAKGDKAATLSDKRKSLDSSKIDALSLKHKLTAVPFSDEWLAALEAAGEDILTLKTGPVQNSPPDKSLPEPSPWSPVKRKNKHEIGPFDCTKCTSLPASHTD